MANNTTQYIGRIATSELEEHMIHVDLLDLPYDLFDAKHPLRIDADVDMGKGKKSLLPDLQNVIIDGRFDCSDFTINQDTVLPDGITELVCVHSVQDLGVLIGKLPKSVTKVVVRSAILNAISKEQGGKLEIAKQFITKYPNVVVTDDKKLNLSEIIKQKTEPVIEKEAQKKQAQKPEAEQIKIKTNDWLSTDEITDMCTKDIALSFMTPEQIKRKIRAAKSNASFIGITVQKMQRAEDGVIVDCVYYGDVPKIVQFIANETHISTKTIKEPKKKIKQQTDTKTETQEKKSKKFVESKEIKTVIIKKYIKKNVWTKISNYCGKDIGKLLAFLRDIQVINVRPTDTQGKQVYYIENDELILSQNIKLKTAKRLTQSFATLNDRYRTIWAMKQDTFIAIDFFSEHEKKHEYTRAIQSKDNPNLSIKDTISVEEKIAELERQIASKTQYAPDTANTEEQIVRPEYESAEPEKPDVIPEQKPIAQEKIQITEPVVSKPENTDVTPDQKPIAQEKPKITEPVVSKPEKPDVTPVQKPIAQEKIQITEPVVSKPEKPDVTPDQKPVVQETTKTRPAVQQVSHVPTFTEIDSMHAQLECILNQVNTDYQQTLTQLIAEQSTDQAIALASRMQDILSRKKAFETGLQKLEEIKNTMKFITELLSNQKQR